MYTDHESIETGRNEALEAAQNAIENEAEQAEDQDSWLMGRDAAAAYRRQDFKAALILYERLLEREPENAWLALQRGQCLFKLHRYHEALQQLQQAEKLGCGDSLLHYWLGKAWFELKKYDQAIAALDTMLVENPYHLRSRFLLLRSYQLNGQADLARQEYAYLISLENLAPEFRRHLGKIAYGLGDIETARQLIMGVLESPNFCHAGNYHLMAQILMKLGENEEARIYLEAALQERQDGFLLKDYGVLLMQLRELDAARDVFMRLEKQRKYEATGRYYLGLVAENAGAYGEAAQSYRLVLQRNPRHLYAALKLATILERQHKPEEALQVLHELAAYQKGNTGLQSRIRALEKEIERAR